MADADTELFSEIYGPYAQATCAIFDRANGGFCLSFDQGPNYNFESWLGDSKTVFKFPAGTVFQLRLCEPLIAACSSRLCNWPRATMRKTCWLGLFRYAARRIASKSFRVLTQPKQL